MSKRAMNAADMKLRNQKKILNALRISPASRADLARQTGLTRAAISVLVDSLLEEGILMEGACIAGKVGRTSTNMQFHKNMYYILGINIARDCCTIGIADFGGCIQESVKLSFLNEQEESKAVLYRITQALRILQDNTQLSGTLLGIGITAPGPLDVQNKTILTPPNFSKWHHLQIADYFEQEFHCPVYLENNSAALALAEQYFGIGSGFRSYMELVVDTGIGGGIMLNGKLYKGTGGFGGDFGHITVCIDGELCSCGNYGCAELYASIPNCIAKARKINPEYITWELLTAAAAKGASDACRILEEESRYLAAIATTALNILDVDAVILSGHLSMLNRTIEERINRQFIGRARKKIQVLSSALNEQANILACINLVLEHFVTDI